MSAITLHETSTITVWCVPAARLIHHQINAYCHGQEFRTALDVGSRAMLEHKCAHWLSDDRKNGPLSPEDAQWAKTVWFPRTKTAGWTHWAIVKPVSVISQLNVQQFIELYGSLGITVRLFTAPEEARLWLTTQP